MGPRVWLAFVLCAAVAFAQDDARRSLAAADVLAAAKKTREAEATYAATIEMAHQARDAKIELEALGKLGYLQYDRGAMADALESSQRAYRLAERLGNEKDRLDALELTAHVYADSNVAQYDRAIEYYRQLETGYAKYGAPGNVADTLFNIGSTYEQKGNQAAAERYFLRALAMFVKLRQQDDVIYTRRALALSLLKQNRAAEALPHLDAAFEYYAKAGDVGNLALVRQYRGMANRRLGRNTAALEDLDAARRYYEAQKNARYLERNVESTALVYEQLGDWRNAYEFRKRLGALQQELATSRRDELASRLRVEFDAAKKEQENRALARENALRATALREAERNQRLQVAVIALTALLAVALGLLFWRQVANTRRMRSMAMTDELTRLPNRRHILAALDIAFAESKRHAREAAVIVFDIDGFKRINDTYGHAAGDEVLKAVARACRRALRPSDQIGRIGGEEFLIVLDGNTSARQAGEIAERLRAAVEELDLSAVAADLRVTISLGVCVTKENDAGAAIAAADSVLYRAKESGRNRVEMAVA